MTFPTSHADWAGESPQEKFSRADKSSLIGTGNTRSVLVGCLRDTRSGLLPQVRALHFRRGDINPAAAMSAAAQKSVYSGWGASSGLLGGRSVQQRPGLLVGQPQDEVLVIRFAVHERVLFIGG